MWNRFRTLLVATAVAGVGFTALVATIPALHFAYERPGLHIAIETTAALIALLAAFLVSGRFGRSRRLSDLLLAAALAMLAAVNLAYSAVPAAVYDAPASAWLTWTVIAGRVTGALILAGSALTPRRDLPRARRAAVAAGGGVLALLLLFGVFFFAFGDRLPQPVAPSAAPASSSPNLDASAALPAVQLGTMVLFAVAALGFARRAGRGGDRFFEWLALAATFASISRLNYFLYPSLYSSWVYLGDFFRLAFYVMMLLGAGWEIRRHWRSLATAAALRERERLARELHDGLAQEIAYIGRQASRLQGDAAAARIVAASARALAESRRAIVALSRPLDEPFGVSFGEVTGSVARRLGVTLELSIDPDLPVTLEQGDALTRIACEGIANAARHGDAKLVRIELRARPRLRLRVADDGRGFSLPLVAEQRSTGYGLRTMRERVGVLGGELRIDAAPGRGTVIEAVL